MRFKFIIKRWANFYYFWHNLADLQWPWPSRKRWKKNLWKEELSPLLKEEKEALLGFNRICFKYVPQKYLGRHFFLDKNPWIALNKEISDEEFSELKNIFSI